MSITTCPNCGVKLKEDSIGYAVDGEMLYIVSLVDDELNYEQDEFNDNGHGGEFFCRECGDTLPITSEDGIAGIIQPQQVIGLGKSKVKQSKQQNNNVNKSNTNQEDTTKKANTTKAN